MRPAARGAARREDGGIDDRRTRVGAVDDGRRLGGLVAGERAGAGGRRGVGRHRVVAGRADARPRRRCPAEGRPPRPGRPAGTSTGSAPRRPRRTCTSAARPAPSDWMNVSGAQNPGRRAQQLASCDWSAAGTSAAGTQCAPLHAGLHAGNCVGIDERRPRVRARRAAAPVARAQAAAVAADDVVDVARPRRRRSSAGRCTGRTARPAPQVSCLRRLTSELPETSVMHSLRQTPWSVHVRSFVVHERRHVLAARLDDGIGHAEVGVAPRRRRSTNALSSDDGRSARGHAVRRPGAAASGAGQRRRIVPGYPAQPF